MNTDKKLVAVAGGTSPTLGTAIVNALAESASCTPVILSRLKPGEDQAAVKTLPSGTKTEVRFADYSNEASLAVALKDVHTIISVLKIIGPDWVTFQLNLLNAAKKAGVKRFAPSEYEQGSGADGKVDIIAPVKLPVWEACKKSGLEVARFECGGFMNAMVVSADKNSRWNDETRAKIKSAAHGLQDDDVLWNLEHETCQNLVKDDGSSPRITLTEIGDIGRFVAASCELADGLWRENMGMVGETLTVKEITEIIEDVTGIKFMQTTVDKKELQKRVDSVEGTGTTRDAIVTKLWAQIELVMLEDEGGAGWLNPVVNEMCPQVKPLKVRQYLKKVFA